MVVGQYVVRQFGLRALIDVITGAGVTALLLVLGVDFAVLWGVLTFFLSFVPYIGLFIALTPAVVLALAESGLGLALLFIVGVIVVNIVAENVLSPMLMGRGLNLSPTVVFLSFILWAWVLGGPGAFRGRAARAQTRLDTGVALVALLRDVGAVEPLPPQQRPPLGRALLDRVTSCGLQVLVQETAEPVASEGLDDWAGGRGSAAAGWVLIK